MGLDFLKTKLFMTAGLISLGFILIFLGQELKKRYVVQQEIKDLEQEISKYEGKNQDFLELISYYKTQEFRERQARSILNLQKPGEFAVVLPPDPATSPTSSLGDIGGGAKSRTNASLWWEYFFGNPAP